MAQAAMRPDHPAVPLGVPKQRHHVKLGPSSIKPRLSPRAGLFRLGTVELHMRIYHNPACGTSRTVLARIRDAGIEPEIIEYLKTPPDRVHLTSLLDRLKLTPRELLRRKGTTLETLGRDEALMSDDEILEVLLANPILMERPIVVTADAARVCRPADRVEDLLP